MTVVPNPFCALGNTALRCCNMGSRSALITNPIGLQTYSTSAMATQGLDAATAAGPESGSADGAGGTELRPSDGYGLRGLPYGVSGALPFRAHVQGQCLHARQPQAGARHRFHQAGVVVPGHAATARGDGAGVANLAQFATAGRHRWPRALADQHGGLPAADQSLLCGQGGATRGGLHSADL